MKVCKKCKVEKELTEFNKAKQNKCGYLGKCRPCAKESAKDYYKKNKEKIDKRVKEYYKNNKEKIKQYQQDNKERRNEQGKKNRKLYTDKQKENVASCRKEYYKKNRDKILKSNKQYVEKNKEHVKILNKKNRDKNRENYNKYYRERRKKDFLFKLQMNLRTLTGSAFRNKGYSKNTKTQSILGIDWITIKKHIEIQFTKGMNWSNYGKWHIDHIIPLISANTEEEIIKLCYYTNLQPLWAFDNIKKGGKILSL